MLYAQKKEELENLVFQTVEGLYQAKYLKDLEKYRLGLSVLEDFLFDYKELTGTTCISDTTLINLYATQWEVEWNT
jgi:hypothetical protein